MQFRLPQFLDIEDKIFGPFTLRQFGYTLGAIGFAYVFWKLIPFKIIAILFILVFSGTFLALAFLKIHNRPFGDILEHAYKFTIKNKTYIWNKNSEIENYNKKTDLRALDLLKKEEKKDNNITLEKIKELSGKLDILDEKKKKNISLKQELIEKMEKDKNNKRFPLL